MTKKIHVSRPVCFTIATGLDFGPLKALYGNPLKALYGNPLKAPNQDYDQEIHPSMCNDAD